MYSCVPGEGRRQRLVEGVREDLLGPLGRGVRGDDVVERPLHVQHHRVQFAVGPRDVDPPRLVVQLLQAEGLRQPAGRVDGEDDDRAARPRPRPAPAPPTSSSCPRRRTPQQTMIRVSAVGDQLAEVHAGASGPGRAGGGARRRSRGRPRLRRWSSSRPASSNSEPTSIGPGSSGSSTVGRPSASTSSRRASCAGPAPGVLGDLGGQRRRRSPRRRAGGRRPAPAASSAPVSPPSAARAMRVDRAAPARWPC